MANKQRYIFISDLHLDENHPEITANFLNLLQRCRTETDALYMLGDFFEVWIGDDNHTPLIDEIVAALRAATDRGLPIYFMHGNRDFLIGADFIKATGCRLLTDDEKISLFQQSVLLMHGDTLCMGDAAYIRMRKLFRNKFIQKIFLCLPLSIRQKIAAKMRAKSQQYTSSADLAIMDVTQTEVERVMREHEVLVLIHGHTHQPKMHSFTLDGHNAQRIVLAAWHDGGSALVWDEDGAKSVLINNV